MKIHLQTDFRSRPPMPFQRFDGGNYYIRQQINKCRLTRSLYTANKKEAKEKAYRLWFYQQHKPITEILEIPQTGFEFIIEAYQNSRQWENLEDSTRAHKLINWRAFTIWADGRGMSNIADVTPETAEFYLNFRDCSNKTFNNVLNDLRLIFAETCRMTRQNNPFDGIPYRSTRKGDRASRQYRDFSDDEIKRILEYIPQSRMEFRDEWHMACQIARYTGLRYKDVAHIQWSQIRSEYVGSELVEYIQLVPCKTVSRVNKAVIIRIASELSQILKTWLKTSFYVLPNLKATYNETHATEPFTGILKQLSITGTETHVAGFHSFRATVATKAKKAGIDMKRLGGVLGHTNEKQTEHYDKSAIEIDMSFLSKTG